jgi:hypothetical protein
MLVNIRLSLIACVMLASPAGAFQQPAQNPDPAATNRTEKLICEKQLVTGSRLASREVCATPEAFAARRLQERQGIERAQAGPCMPTGSDSMGRAHC